MSRHRQATFMVLNEGAIRQAIASKHVDAKVLSITPTDVLLRAAADMSRRPERGSSLDMLDRVTDKRRGAVADFQIGNEPVERQAMTPGLSAFRKMRLAISPIMQQIAGYAHDIQQRTRGAGREAAPELGR
jgi:hypothetical protein